MNVCLSIQLVFLLVCNYNCFLSCNNQLLKQLFSVSLLTHVVAYYWTLNNELVSLYFLFTLCISSSSRRRYGTQFMQTRRTLNKQMYKRSEIPIFPYYFQSEPSKILFRHVQANYYPPMHRHVHPLWYTSRLPAQGYLYTPRELPS